MADGSTKSDRAPGAPPARRAPRAWTPERPKSRGAAPATIGELLVGAQAHVAARSGTAFSHSEWRAVVGPKIAGRSRVGRLSRGVLTIKVASSAWSNELAFLRSDLLARLHRAGHEIKDLRFVVDRIGDVEPARGVSRAGKVGKSSGLLPNASEPPRTVIERPEVALPPELERRLLQIDDPNLRAAIAEAARFSLRPK